MKTTYSFIFLGLAMAGMALGADDKWDISKLDVSKLPPASTKANVTYATDIQPIFEKACFRCHGQEKQKGDLELDTLAAALKGGEDGKVIIPGDSKASLLVAAIAQVSDEVAMPPKHKGGRGGGPGGHGGPPGDGHDGPPPGGPDGGNPPPPPQDGGPNGPRGDHAGGPGGPPKPLTAEQVGLVRAWIDQGAK